MKITKTIKGLLLLSTALFVFETVTPPQAHAQITTDIATEIETGLTATVTSLTSTLFDWQKIKEEVLDPLAWSMAKSLLQTMTSDTVKWINSGFKGSPAFLTNPTAFFTNAADQLTGQFLSSTTGPLSNLCSPFSVNLRLQLAYQQAGNGAGANNKYSCTLSSVINNVKNSSVSVNGKKVATIDGFTKGDFSQGGWPAFIAISQPQNNESGAYLQAQSDLSLSIANKQGEYQQQLAQGNGFLTFQKCDDIPSVDENFNETVTHVCQNETPGSVISASLNKELGNPTDTLVQASMIDEVIGALVAQTMQQVLSGGLYSSTQPGANGEQSFIARMAADQSANTSQKAASHATADAGKYIGSATQIKAQYDKAVADIENASSTYQTLLAQCQTNDPAAITGVQSIIDTQITPLLSTYQYKDATASSTLNTLTQIQATTNAATSTDAVNAATQQYTDLLSSNSVPTAVDVQNAKSDVASVDKTLLGIQNQAIPYQSASMCGKTTTN